MSNTIQIPSHLTEELFDYMTYRAAQEKLEMSLEHKWFAVHFHAGYRSFFGIELDDEGNLLSDSQQPNMLEAWRARN